jgi:hypothetical protein
LTCSYRFISEHRDTFGVAQLCRVLQARRPGFYEWLAVTTAREQRATRDDRLAAPRRVVFANLKAETNTRVWTIRDRAQQAVFAYLGLRVADAGFVRVR